MILQDHVKNCNHYISGITRPMDINEELPLRFFNRMAQQVRLES